MTQVEARRQSVIGLYDEHYSGLVSVYRIGDKSLEFCGGPHARDTAELGRFHIVKEQSVGAGLRRIRAVLTPSRAPRNVAVSEAVSRRWCDATRVLSDT